MSDPPARYLNVSEVAVILGVHVRTVRRWANTVLVPAVITPGGHRRYRQEDVEAFAESLKTS